MEDLDLKELFEMFWSRKIYIILIVLIFFLIGCIYSYLFVAPDYKSETSLLLVKQDSTTSSSEGVTTTDLTLNQKLVSTYSELIKSEIVLGKVIENLGIEISEETLKKSITVSSVKDTELIKISVVNEKPENAKLIASEIVTVFTEEVKRIYKIDNVNVIGEAKVPENPYNINHIKDLVIFVFIGIIVAAVYVLIANMLDTTVKGKDDLEKKVGLSLLTEIPLCDFTNERKLSGKGGKK